MQKNSISIVTKDVLESGRKVAGNLISTTRHGTGRALGGCDRAWKAGAHALAVPRMPITEKLRDDLISLEGQLTLIARYLVRGVADRTEKTVNGIADSAISTVGHFDPVFDTRVVQSLSGLGMPIAETIRTLAHRIVVLSSDLDQFIAGQKAVTAKSAHTRAKTAVRAKRKPVAKTTRRARKAA